MRTIVRRVARVGYLETLFWTTGTVAAYAAPRPVEPAYPSPAPVPTEPRFATEVRWMLGGAALVLAVAAVVLVVVLWRRSHSAARRIAAL
ncbi:MAG: hypothetical protein QOI54_3230 [Actinomycetota bacterium]|jgi:hypothetical protein|nr:hypothetical protein [Actinomycetota bacterium]